MSFVTSDTIWPMYSTLFSSTIESVRFMWWAIMLALWCLSSVCGLDNRPATNIRCPSSNSFFWSSLFSSRFFTTISWIELFKRKYYLYGWIGRHFSHISICECVHLLGGVIADSFQPEMLFMLRFLVFHCNRSEQSYSIDFYSGNYHFFWIPEMNERNERNDFGMNGMIL